MAVLRSGALALKGEPFDISGRVATVPGTEVPVWSFTVDAGKKRNLVRIHGSCPISGVFRAYQGVDLIGEARSAPGRPDCSIVWDVAKPFAAGAIVALKFEQRLGSPISTVFGLGIGTEET